MKIVINISEYDREWIRNAYGIPAEINTIITEAIINGEIEDELVRCKDCKYAEVADIEDSQDGYICQFHRGSIWFSGSYCSWAERKEE